MIFSRVFVEALGVPMPISSLLNEDGRIDYVMEKNFHKETAMRSTFSVASIFSVIAFVLSTSANGGIVYEWDLAVFGGEAANRLIPANDFHVVFDVPNGTIANPVLNPDPDPNGSGVASVNGAGTGIDIEWGNLVDTDDGFTVFFDSFLWPIQVEDIYWTLNGQRILTLGPADYKLTKVPAPGSLALLGIGGVVATRRRR